MPARPPPEQEQSATAPRSEQDGDERCASVEQIWSGEPHGAYDLVLRVRVLRRARRSVGVAQPLHVGAPTVGGVCQGRGMPLLLSPPSAGASEPVVLSRPDPSVLAEVRALLDPVAPRSCLGTVTGD